MSEGKLEKPEQDFTQLVDKQLPETETLATQGLLSEALEQLLGLEKQTRQAADLASSTRVLVHIVKLCYQARDWKLLNEYVILLSKKHGQLKQAITKMVQEVMTYLDDTPDKPTKLELIDTLRTVTEGKIREEDGKINEAADILQELQKREKTDFILEQMRLTLAKKDYTRMQIISKKINTKFFADVEQQVLENVIYFIILSPYDNEQSDLLNRIYKDPNLHFITPELIPWSMIQETYGTALRQTSVFLQNDEHGEKHWQDLHKRVIEHVPKYYKRIRTKRLSQLLDLNDQDTEDFLSKLVVSKTIYAKIDRPAGIVSFAEPKDPNQVLNDWSNNINSLLGLIEKTCHLITKEEMLHSIARVK
ncbi:119_t:CDS:10 [Entrophospora sp. SA101]|nr:119_t:CDS:10 [Entrophospora sp. SA101]CAJ0841026.1 389_t:CDS:10 [Entrophospora sp. SA101]CAJ0917868.1 15146_t:CDS:10 [Entrophospora sp. SA101]